MNSEVRKGLVIEGSAIVGLTGGLWYPTAVFQNKPIYPYAVLSSPTETRRSNTKENFDIIIVRFNVFHTDVEELEALQKLFDEKFALQRLNIQMDNYNLVGITKAYDSGVIEPEKGKFQFTQQYKVTIEHK